MIIKLTLKTNTKPINSKIESAIEVFKDMESQLIYSVDIEKCIKDYVDAIFIYDTRLVTIQSPD